MNRSSLLAAVTAPSGIERAFAYAGGSHTVEVV